MTGIFTIRYFVILVNIDIFYEYINCWKYSRFQIGTDMRRRRVKL